VEEVWVGLKELTQRLTEDLAKTEDALKTTMDEATHMDNKGIDVKA
jgi:hypothetical protein